MKIASYGKHFDLARNRGVVSHHARADDLAVKHGSRGRKCEGRFDVVEDGGFDSEPLGQTPKEPLNGSRTLAVSGDRQCHWSSASHANVEVNRAPGAASSDRQ